MGDTSELPEKVYFHILVGDVFLPTYIFGLQFTKFGFIINWIWFDLVFYGWVRAKQMIGDDK